MSYSRRPCAVVFLLACLLPLPGLAQTKAGGEIQVNTYTENHQRAASVSRDADGDFVVAWTSSGQDGAGSGMFARRFNAAGLGQASEFQVNSYTEEYQSQVAVALDTDGDFVVAWASYGQDGDNYGVFARRFDSAGSAQGLELQVNSHVVGFQGNPSVSLSAAGDFVVAWSSRDQDGSDYGAFVRRFDAAGVAQAVELQVNDYTLGDQSDAVVSLDADGDFVVAWRSDAQDGDGGGIFARRFNSAGDAQDAEFQVNTYTGNAQDHPAVALDGDGDFVVAWESNYQDGDARGVFARRFNAAGDAQAAEFGVNSYTPSGQYSASVSADTAGNFVVTWNSFAQDGSSSGIFARRFNAAGVPQTSDFLVNTRTTNAQSASSVSLGAGGGFVVAWQGGGQDGSDNGVFAQRFEEPAVLDVDGNGTTDALTDGLLTLRFLFGFTGATLVNGVVDLGGCTRCDAPAIQAYLATLN